MAAGDRPKRYTKHAPGVAPAGSNTDTTSVRPLPANESRVSLFIQNTGLNAGLVRFNESIQNDGSDMAFAPGSGILWDREATVPLSAVNIGSLLGTTFCIIETAQPE